MKKVITIFTVSITFLFLVGCDLLQPTYTLNFEPNTGEEMEPIE